MPMLIAAAIVLLVLLLIVLRRRLNKTRHRRRLDKILRQFQQEEVRSLVIPDGIGGFLELDQLLLTDRGLLIIQAYPMIGHLFGGEQIEQWTQIIGGRSFKFVNPLHHVENAKYALQLLAPKVPIFYRVVFTGQCDFPKGKPEHVSTLQTLEQDLQVILEAPKMSDSNIKAWKIILSIGQKSGQDISREAIS
ncbi:MAG: hypothetical protein Kow0083_02550 [Methylophaga sp.]